MAPAICCREFFLALEHLRSSRGKIFRGPRDVTERWIDTYNSLYMKEVYNKGR